MGDGTGNGPAGRHVRQQKISAEPDVRARAQCSLRMNNDGVGSIGINAVNAKLLRKWKH